MDTKILLFIDERRPEETVTRAIKVNANLDIRRLRVAIETYKKEVKDWQFEELIDVCLNEAGAQILPLEDMEIKIYL